VREITHLAVSAAYRACYEDQEQKRYHPDSGKPYPWTRLGYTFDWGNPDSRVGLSEFIVMAGTAVVIESKTPTSSYGRGDHTRN
jgi:hypothetical protein